MSPEHRCVADCAPLNVSCEGRNSHGNRNDGSTAFKTAIEEVWVRHHQISDLIPLLLRWREG